MKNLNRMAIFSVLVEAGNFTEAARRLGIARSAVSRQIRALEDEIGVSLVYRSTRQFTLTEAGQLFYQSCARIVQEADHITQQMSHLQKKPKGKLRIASTINFGAEYLASTISGFKTLYPDLQIELILNDASFNLVEEGIDISIEMGRLNDSALIARKLHTFPNIICGSENYFKSHAMPKKPSDLIKYNWVIYTSHPSPYQWTFKQDKRFETIQITGDIKTNSENAMRAFILNDAGIGILPLVMVNNDLKHGKLLPLLKNYSLEQNAVYAVYPRKENVPSKVRLFLDYVLSRKRDVSYLYPDGQTILIH